MRVQAIQQCDALVGGRKRAMFPGQFYDVPDSDAEQLVTAGLALVVDQVSGSSLSPVIHVRTRARGRGDTR